MGISGLGSYNYSNYYQNTTRTSAIGKQNTNTFSSPVNTSSNITLHFSGTDGGDNALTAVGFPNGGSASVYKASNYQESDPEYLVKYWDENGETQEYNVKPKEVDPSNASYLEMLAYSTYSDVQGYTSNAYGDFLAAAGGVNGELSYDSSNINEKTNFKSLVGQFMQMQYDAGNMSGYLSYKQFYDYMDSTAGSDDDYAKILEKYGEQIKEKIMNGDTEPTYQLGGQTFTEAEWKKLIEKMDKNIDAIKAEQEENTNNHQDDEKVSANNEKTVLSGTATAFDPDTYHYFGTEGMTVYTKDGTPLAEKALTDQRYTDKETGISWYVGEDGRPYMVGDDADKFNDLCKESGEFPLKKFAEMTGIIQYLDDNTAVYVADNGIVVKGKDGSEYSFDRTGMSYDDIMSMLLKATGGGDYFSEKYWNQIKNQL